MSRFDSPRPGRFSRRAVLLLLLANLSLAQVSSELVSADVKRVGSRLACLCGTCKNTVADCPMIECHYAKPAKQKIDEMAAAGVADQKIIDAFIEEHGLQALAAPPPEGFNLLGWVMPFVAIGMGLALIGWFMRRYHGPGSAVPEVDDGILERYRDRIEKDLQKTD
jgi:cytochrome c-type biogenesis protein CcmH